MPLKSYALSQDLIDGLAELSVRSQVSVNSLVRQAIRRELEREGILVRQSRAEEGVSPTHNPCREKLEHGAVQTMSAGTSNG
jgi:hypothetical protein